MKKAQKIITKIAPSLKLCMYDCTNVTYVRATVRSKKGKGLMTLRWCAYCCPDEVAAKLTEVADPDRGCSWLLTRKERKQLKRIRKNLTYRGHNT